MSRVLARHDQPATDKSLPDKTSEKSSSQVLVLHGRSVENSTKPNQSPRPRSSLATPRKRVAGTAVSPGGRGPGTVSPRTRASATVSQPTVASPDNFLAAKVPAKPNSRSPAHSLDDVLYIALVACFDLLHSAIQLCSTDLTEGMNRTRQFRTALQNLADTYSAASPQTTTTAAFQEAEDAARVLLKESELQLVTLLELTETEVRSSEKLKLPTQSTARQYMQKLTRIVESELVYRSKDEASELVERLVKGFQPLTLDEEFRTRVLPLLRAERVDAGLHYWPRFDELRPAGRLAPTPFMGFPDHAAQRELVRKRFALPHRFPAMVRPHQHLHIVGPRGCGKKFLARAAHTLIHVEDDSDPFARDPGPVYELDARVLASFDEGKRAALLTCTYEYLQQTASGSGLAPSPATAECSGATFKAHAPPSVRTLLVTHAHELGVDVPRPQEREHSNVLAIFTSEESFSRPLESDVEVRVALPTFAVRRSVVLHSLFETLQVGTLVPEGASARVRAAVTSGFFENAAMRKRAELVARATGPDWEKVREAILPRGADTHAWNLMLLEQVAALPPEIVVHHFARKPQKARELLQRLKDESVRAPTAAGSDVDASSVREVLENLRLDLNEGAREEEEAKKSEELRRDLLHDAKSAPLAFAWELERAERCAAELLNVCNVAERVSSLENVQGNLTYLKSALEAGAALIKCPTGTVDISNFVTELKGEPSKLETFRDERHLLRFVAQLEGQLEDGQLKAEDEYAWGSAPERCATFEQEAEKVVQGDSKRFAKRVEEYRRPEPLAFRHDLTEEQEVALYTAVYQEVMSKFTNDNEVKDSDGIWEDFVSTFGNSDKGSAVKSFELEDIASFLKFKFALESEVAATRQPLGLVAQTVYYAYLAAEKDGQFPSKSELFPYYVRYRNAVNAKGKLDVYVGDVAAEQSSAKRAERARQRAARAPLLVWNSALEATHAPPCGLSELSGARNLRYASALQSQEARLPTFHRLDALHALPMLLAGSASAARAIFWGAQDRAALQRRVEEFRKKAEKVRNVRFQELVKKKPEWSTDLKSGEFCDAFQQKVRWAFVGSAGDAALPAPTGTVKTFETRCAERARVRDEWLKKLHEDSARVEWTFLQTVYSRFSASLFPDENTAPENVFMFVAESALHAPRATACPETEDVRTAFLKYTLTDNVRAKDELDKLYSARETAAYEHAARTFLQCVNDASLRSQVETTLLTSPAPADASVRATFWELARATALCLKTEQVLNYLKSTAALPAEHAFALRYVTAFDKLLQAPGGDWRQRLAEVQVYTEEKVRRPFRHAQRSQAFAEAACRERAPPRNSASPGTSALQLEQQLEARADRLRAQFLAYSPFGCTCSELADAVRRGAENFLFCRLALKFDAVEQCYFYCFQDATLQRARCAHGAQAACRECPLNESRARTFLRDLNTLLFDSEGHTASGKNSAEPGGVRPDDSLLAAATTAEVLLEALQRIEPENDTFFQALRTEFGKAMRAAGASLAPRANQDFVESVLLKRRERVRAASRFLQEGLWESVMLALAEAKPIDYGEGVRYARYALQQYRLEQ